MIIVQDNAIPALREIFEFVEVFVDYHIDEKSIDGQPTDAESMRICLPTLKGVIDSEKVDNIVSQEDLKNIVYNAEKRGREAVRPLYKYCVVDSDIRYCYVTDDIGKAMEKAASLSKTSSDFQYVLNIRQANDGSYKTFYEARYYEGKWYDTDMRDFLHFDYILQRVGSDIYKI